MARNIYMGPNSRAKIPVRGKVDTYLEILANAYATAYDASDGWLLTRTGRKRATIDTINGRFKVLYILASRNAPRALSPIHHLHQLVIRYMHGALGRRSYLYQIRQVAVSAGLPPHLVTIIESRIRRAEHGR